MLSIFDLNIYYTISGLSIILIAGKKNQKSKKKIRFLILNKNTNSSLVSDIAKIDFAQNHLGRTYLKDLKSLPIFIGNLFVFSYLPEMQCMRKKKEE